MVILGGGDIHRIRHGYTWEHIGSSHTEDTHKRYSILGDMWELPRTVLGWALGSCICLQWGRGSALGLSLGTALPFTLTCSGNPFPSVGHPGEALQGMLLQGLARVAPADPEHSGPRVLSPWTAGLCTRSG